MYISLKQALFILIIVSSSPVMAMSVSEPQGSNIELGKADRAQALKTAQDSLRKGREIIKEAENALNQFKKKKAINVRAGLKQIKFMHDLSKHKRVAQKLFEDIKSFQTKETDKIEKAITSNKSPREILELSGNYYRYLEEYVRSLRALLIWSITGKTKLVQERDIQALIKLHTR